MKFGEKIKNARVAKGLTQAELAKTVGVSLRTMLNYESGERYPKKREIYSKLASALDLDVNYLLTENEEFISKAGEKYGSRGKKYAQQLVTEVSGLFAGGDMDDADMDAVMRAITDAYWIAKEKNKKFTPKKYRKAEKI